MAKDTKINELLTQDQLKEIKQRQDWRNVLSIISNWSQIFICFWLLYSYPSWVVFLISLIVVGSRQFALAVLMHEGAHKLLFSNLTINDWVAQWLCAYPIFQDTKPYRPYHLKHHKFTETKQDPDLILSAPFPISKSSLRRKIFRDLVGLTGWKRYSSTLISIFSTKADNLPKKFILVSKKLRGFLVSNLVIFLFISYFFNWYIFFLLWWLPSLTYYSLIIRVRNIAEHVMVPNQNNLDNTRTTIASPVIRYLMVPHNVNYHLEHHLFISCPWYNLRKAHNMLKKNGFLDKMCIENSYLSVLKKASSG